MQVDVVGQSLSNSLTSTQSTVNVGCSVPEGKYSTLALSLQIQFLNCLSEAERTESTCVRKMREQLSPIKDGYTSIVCKLKSRKYVVRDLSCSVFTRHGYILTAMRFLFLMRPIIVSMLSRDIISVARVCQTVNLHTATYIYSFCTN